MAIIFICIAGHSCLLDVTVPSDTEKESEVEMDVSERVKKQLKWYDPQQELKEDWPHRWSVRSRGGFTTYDTFTSLDDAISYIFECMQEDILFIDFLDIEDLRSGLILSPANLKWFHRKLSGLEK